ncbi:acetolactate synthase small subunit [uncultured Robinsoniella sp.]|uniref:acetolactate synthase small subunit n=1 Tax=uncultured Robinsoniella sp. TaxID=904190 RepID=UPI00374EB79B
MKKRWISLLVENEVGVLARISGLFSGKSYNLNSLTVGPTEDITISRMTISLTSDDRTFEQIKKQLNRSIEVIKVTDFTNTATHMKEVMYLKLSSCSEPDLIEMKYVTEVFDVKLIDYDRTAVLIESVHNESKNNDLINFFEKHFTNRFEIVRGGSVAIEAMLN